MKLNKQFEEKLRKYLALTEVPLFYVKQALKIDNPIQVNKCIEALQLRKELIGMINSKPTEGKYKQLDIEEAIEEEKLKKSSHENY
jgi:hypothetical protein